jgi:hypothetical protein
MKPGKYDKKHSILIAGAELQELKRHTWMMAESFGLDRRIENYQGKRPLGLYRWDLECLLDVVDMALVDKKAYPSQNSVQYRALQNLHQRLKAEYTAYDEPR